MDTSTKTQNHKITVYSTEFCKYCHMMKEYLTEKGFEYESIDIGKDAAQAQIVRDKSGQLGVPVTEIDGHIVVGYDPDAVDELLK
jgi:glutaredoxin 3